MVELQRPVVGEPATFTSQFLLIIVKPQAELTPPLINDHPPTLLTLQITIYLAEYFFADREGFVR